MTDSDSLVVTRRFTKRSADTRAAILSAARARFAADGYEKATIRAIAADAGIDASMVMRYYGDKAGLFRAAAFSDIDLSGLAAGSTDLHEVADRVARVLTANWESGENQVQRLLVRTAFTHPEAVAHLQRFLDDHFMPPILAALADDPDAELRAGLLFSLTFGILSTRYLLGLEPVASADSRLVESAVRDAVELVLTRPMR